MYKTSEIARLLKKKWQGNITPTEEILLKSWACEAEENAALLKKIEDGEELLGDVMSWLEMRNHNDNWLQRLQINTLSKIQSTKIVPLYSGFKDIAKQRNVFRKLLPYAASVVAVSMIVLVYFNLQPQESKTIAIKEIADLAPGKNRATITMSNGDVIELKSDKEAIVLGEQLTYEDGSLISELGEDEEVQSVLETPKGGSYQIKLTDGTRVWLNADSKLTYPIKFTGEQRVVVLEGEAFFEVTTFLRGGKKVPFIVKMQNGEVEVLGTQFNVMAYKSEVQSQTTLVEGAVKVQEILLKPGEQAVAGEGGISKRKVEVEQFIAWKNDEFVFNETELKVALRTLARWYDFEVVYEGELSPTYLYGNISRKKGLAEVLKIMETSGLKFKIQKVGNTNRLIVNS